MVTAPMTISLDEHVARAIYEAMGFAYDGRTINGRGQPYGEWAKAIKAARAAIAAVREREGKPPAEELPFAYAYVYPTPFGGTTFRFQHGEYNGSRPIETIPLYRKPQAAPDPAEAMRAKCEVQEWEGYINGLTLAGNLRSRLVVDDSTGLVLNDIRRQIQDAIDKAHAQLAALKGNGAGK